MIIMNSFKKYDLIKQISNIHNTTVGLNLTDCRALLRTIEIIEKKVKNSK